jgi:hypothetical protein
MKIPTLCGICKREFDCEEEDTEKKKLICPDYLEVICFNCLEVIYPDYLEDENLIKVQRQT